MYCSFKRKYVETLGSRSSLNCFQYTALQTMFFFFKKKQLALPISSCESHNKHTKPKSCNNASMTSVSTVPLNNTYITNLEPLIISTRGKKKKNTGANNLLRWALQTSNHFNVYFSLQQPFWGHGQSLFHRTNPNPNKIVSYVDPFLP